MCLKAVLDLLTMKSIRSLSSRLSTIPSPPIITPLSLYRREQRLLLALDFADDREIYITGKAAARSSRQRGIYRRGASSRIMPLATFLLKPAYDLSQVMCVVTQMASAVVTILRSRPRSGWNGLSPDASPGVDHEISPKSILPRTNIRTLVNLRPSSISFCRSEKAWTSAACKVSS